MKSQELKKDQLPDNPGVYFFKRGRGILYIGKATSLKDRVKSYFNGDILETRGPKIEQMLKLTDKVDWQETDSVLEALILEAELIKKYQPPYNSREKDDKSYWYVVITKEDYPRVLPLRGRLLAQPDKLKDIKIKYQFGPYPYASEIKEALKIIRKIFTYRDKCQPNSSRPCFNYQIGLCPGVCMGEISKTGYQKIIRNIVLFFQGKKKQVIKNLEKEMKKAAKEQEFEKAARLRNQIFSLQHIHDVSLLKKESVNTFSTFRIEAYDIAHLGGSATVGALAVWQNGQLDKDEYRRFKIQGPKATIPDDTANLTEILRRRFAHLEWLIPDLIVVDGGQAQINAASQVLTSLRIKSKIVSVVKNEHHQPREILGDKSSALKYRREIILANSEAHRFSLSYHRKIMRQVVK